MTDNTSYGPEIISLNTYVDFASNLKIGGKFDVAAFWNSDDGSVMNANIKVFS
jgi:hypothetical protein